MKFVIQKIKTSHYLSDNILTSKTFTTKNFNTYFLNTNSTHNHLIKGIKEDEYGYYKNEIPYIEIQQSYITPDCIAFDSNKKLVQESLNTFYDFDDIACPLEKFYYNHNRGALKQKINNIGEFAKRKKSVLRLLSKNAITAKILNLLYKLYNKILYNSVVSRSPQFVKYKKLAFQNYSSHIFKSSTIERLDENLCAVLCFDHYYGNFTHFILECFPRLYLFSKLNQSLYGKKSAALIVPSMNKLPKNRISYINESLDLLKIPQKNRLYLANTVIHSSNTILIKQHKFHPAVYESIQYLIRNSITKTMMQKYSRYKRVIFIRNTEDIRQIKNQKKLITFLEAYGFYPITIGQLSIKEKINLLQNAEIIVTGFGSEFTNSIFAKAHCKIICLIHHDAPIYNKFIATLFNIEVIYHKCKAVHELWQTSDIEVDLDKLGKTLDHLDQKAAHSTPD